MSASADKVALWLGDSSDDTDSDDSSSDTSITDRRDHTASTTEKHSVLRDPALPLHPAASMFAVQRSLHRTKHDLRNRLHSIHHDAVFVSAVAALFSSVGFACYANLRQGAWCQLH